MGTLTNDAPLYACIQVLSMCQGQLPITLLDLPRTPVYSCLFSSTRGQSRGMLRHKTHPTPSTSHMTEHDTTPTGSGQTIQPVKPAPGKPVRMCSAGQQPGGGPVYISCGWMFDQEDVFDRGRLLQLLQQLQPLVARVKGIIHVGKQTWVMPVTKQCLTGATRKDHHIISTNVENATTSKEYEPMTTHALDRASSGQHDANVHSAQDQPQHRQGMQCSSAQTPVAEDDAGSSDGVAPVEGAQIKGSPGNGSKLNGSANSQTLVLEPVCYVRESRLEIILDAGALRRVTASESASTQTDSNNLTHLNTKPASCASEPDTQLAPSQSSAAPLEIGMQAVLEHHCDGHGDGRDKVTDGFEAVRAALQEAASNSNWEPLEQLVLTCLAG